MEKEYWITFPCRV